MSPSSLTGELRVARPAAPHDLRERVRAIAVREPEPPSRRPRLRLTARRIAFVLAPACVLALVGAAVIHGLVTSGSPRRAQTATAESLAPAAGADKSLPAAGVAGGASPQSTAPQQSAAPLPPSRTRLEDYRAYLRVRVGSDGALSRATQRAMRTARSLGGYVVSVDYHSADGRPGGADLVLRIPTAHVQEAVLRFSQLGTIVSQQFSVNDLQRRANELDERVATLRGAIGNLERKLTDPSLSAERRRALEASLAQNRKLLASATAQKAATVRQGRLATVSLQLTTEKAAVAPSKRPGRLGRALHDAGRILSRELAIALLVVAVGGPLAVLAALGVLAARVRRRRVEERLLERA